MRTQGTGDTVDRIGQQLAHLRDARILATKREETFRAALDNGGTLQVFRAEHIDRAVKDYPTWRLAQDEAQYEAQDEETD
jgi:hypothetical protein